MENKLTTKKFNEIMKEVFIASAPNEKRQFMVGMDFIKGMRKSNGDKFTYEFLDKFIIQCDTDTYDYIIDFLKEFEADKTN
jgi:hypothetical protein